MNFYKCAVMSGFRKSGHICLISIIMIRMAITLVKIYKICHIITKQTAMIVLPGLRTVYLHAQT